MDEARIWDCKHKEIIKGANEEVTREDRWGKLTHNQVTRWVGSRQIDMRAHGTQKTRTEAHGQQTNHHPCVDTDTQLMRKIISHVFSLRDFFITHTFKLY